MCRELVSNERFLCLKDAEVKAILRCQKSVAAQSLTLECSNGLNNRCLHKLPNSEKNTWFGYISLNLNFVTVCSSSGGERAHKIILLETIERNGQCVFWTDDWHSSLLLSHRLCLQEHDEDFCGKWWDKIQAIKNFLFFKSFTKNSCIWLTEHTLAHDEETVRTYLPKKNDVQPELLVG